MLGFFVFLMALGLSNTDSLPDCGPHQALEGGTCVQCPTCSIGTGITKPCGYGIGGSQRCLPCPEGTYHSDVSDSMCVPCADCAWYRRSVKYRCRPVINAECGNCLPGYFDDETDARDRSALSRCTTCSAMPNAPECLQVIVSSAKVIEISSTVDPPCADASPHSGAILTLQILSMVFCLCVCSYLGYKYIRSRRPGPGKCLHVNLWCKGGRLAEEGEVHGDGRDLCPEGRHHQMENFRNHRREGCRRSGSEGESLIDSFSSTDTMEGRLIAKSPVASTSTGKCETKRGKAKGIHTREDGQEAKHSEVNLYSRDHCMKNNYHEKITRSKSPGCPKGMQDHDSRSNFATIKEPIEKPPAVVQNSRQMAAPTIDDIRRIPINTETPEVFINIPKRQLECNPIRATEPILSTGENEGGCRKPIGQKAEDSMEDDPDLRRVFGPQTARDNEDQRQPNSASQQSSDKQSCETAADSVSMSNTGYPSQGSTLLIRGISIDNQLGSSHGGSRISIQGTDRGERREVPVDTAADKGEDPRGQGPMLSLRAPDNIMEEDYKTERHDSLRHSSTLPQPMRGPLTDITNNSHDNRACKYSPPSMPWERVRSDMRVYNEENQGKAKPSNKQNGRESDQLIFGDAQNGIIGEMGNVTSNSGNTTTTNGGHNLNIYINNNFIPPQLSGTEATIDLRSLFETGNLTPNDVNFRNARHEIEAGDSPDIPNVNQPVAVIKTSPSQTRPKVVSPLLPRGCGMASRKDSAVPVQETVKS